jgi:hypothetical protein
MNVNRQNVPPGKSQVILGVWVFLIDPYAVPPNIPKIEMNGILLDCMSKCGKNIGCYDSFMGYSFWSPSMAGQRPYPYRTIHQRDPIYEGGQCEGE